MATRQFILMSDERTIEHATWGGHPETRDRVTAVCGRLRTGNLAPSLAEKSPRAEVAFIVRDEWPNLGIGSALLAFWVDST